MARELFLETFWCSGTVLLTLLVMVALKFTFTYLWKGRRLPDAQFSREVEPEGCQPDLDARMDELEEVLRRPVKVEPVQPIQPVRVQPKPKSKTVEILPVTTIECAKCSKQIKSPPIFQQEGKPTQYKCEHCGTTVALA